MTYSFNSIFIKFINKGYLGVDLFFELSGFVIALNYFAMFDKRFSLVSYGKFLGIRLARIYPLHAFMMFAFVLNPIAINLFSKQHYSNNSYRLPYFLMSLCLIQNWGFVDQLDWNVPSWSISTEWFAYLVFPAISVAASKFGRTMINSVIMIFLLLVILAICGAFFGGLGGDIPHFGIVRCVLEFAAGVLLFRVWLLHRATSGVPGELTICLSATIFIMYWWLQPDDFLIVPIGFLFIVFSLSDMDGLLSRALSARPLEWIGLISYSTYLLHFFVRDWVKFIMVKQGADQALPTFAYLAVTMIGSVLLYHLIEMPGRKSLRSWVEHVSRAGSSAQAGRSSMRR